MSKLVRARRGVPALLHPETGALVVPNPDTPVEASDSLVKKFPWAFISDEELVDELAAQRSIVTEVSIETATSRPGEKRATKKP